MRTTTTPIKQISRSKCVGLIRFFRYCLFFCNHYICALVIVFLSHIATVEHSLQHRACNIAAASLPSCLQGWFLWQRRKRVEGSWPLPTTATTTSHTHTHTQLLIASNYARQLEAIFATLLTFTDAKFIKLDEHLMFISFVDIFGCLALGLNGVSSLALPFKATFQFKRAVGIVCHYYFVECQIYSLCSVMLVNSSKVGQAEYSILLIWNKSKLIKKHFKRFVFIFYV